MTIRQTQWSYRREPAEADASRCPDALVFRSGFITSRRVGVDVACIHEGEESQGLVIIGARQWADHFQIDVEHFIATHRIRRASGGIDFLRTNAAIVETANRAWAACKEVFIEGETVVAHTRNCIFPATQPFAISQIRVEHEGQVLGQREIVLVLVCEHGIAHVASRAQHCIYTLESTSGWHQGTVTAITRPTDAYRYAYSRFAVVIDVTLIRRR